MSHHFATGLLWGTPLQDAKGTAVSNPTPLIWGTMQDMELDFKFELKKLHGQNQFAVAVGRGKGDITGKIKAADCRMGFLETIVFGQSATSGVLAMVNDTQGAAVPAAAPYTITPTIPDGGTFDKDLGLIDVSTGRELKRVATPAAAGEYSVSAGVYTFAAASATKQVYVNFRYTSTSTTTKTLTIRSLPMGYAPTFSVDYYSPFQGKNAVMSLNSCTADGWKWSSKNDDFTVPEIGFSVQADASGVIGKISFTE